MLLPVRAWRGSRLQLASEKQDSPGKGSLLVDHRTLLLRVGVVADNVGVDSFSEGFPMGEPLRRLCVPFFGTTLKCNTQRAHLLRFALSLRPARVGGGKRRWKMGTIRFRLLWWGRCFTFFSIKVSFNGLKLGIGYY